MWEIPGKIRFMWPSENRAEEEAAWTRALWAFLSQCLPPPRCKNAEGILRLIHWVGGNHLLQETIVIDIFCSVLPLFSSYSRSHPVGLLLWAVWEPITMVMNEMDSRLFFPFTFHPLTRWLVSTLDGGFCPFLFGFLFFESPSTHKP